MHEVDVIRASIEPSRGVGVTERSASRIVPHVSRP
jgi:hypothetical protein